jgi:hypothetical protein
MGEELYFPHSPVFCTTSSGRRALFTTSDKVRKGKTTDTFRYRWFEAVPLRDGKDTMLVN